MPLILGILFLAATLAFFIAHVSLLIHIARTRRWTVLLAAVVIPPIAPLTCAETAKPALTRTWFIALAVYAALLVVTRYARS